jgi:N-acetylglucosaminyldiphosphoundecaprenol N-acetyl-beta-D-mannosaminyltransferase
VEPEHILGVPVDPLTLEEAVEQLRRHLQADSPTPVYTCAINPEKIMRARREPALRQVLERAALRIPDGIGVVLASRLRGGKVRQRVTGIDLAVAMCQEAARHGWPVYLLGAAPGVAERAAQELKARYPGLVVAGTHHGYLGGKDEEVCQEIARTQSRILLVALGSPAQEYWLARYLERTGCVLGMGVGGTLDVLAGNVRRAPPGWQRLGLEWLYRLLHQPSRLGRMRVLPVFLFMALMEPRPAPPGTPGRSGRP